MAPIQGSAVSAPIASGDTLAETRVRARGSREASDAPTRRPGPLRSGSLERSALAVGGEAGVGKRLLARECRAISVLLDFGDLP